DLRLAIRRLSRQPGFAVTSVLILGLGLGATVTLFAVVDAVLVRPLPYPEAERIHMLHAERTDGERLNFTGNEVTELRAGFASAYDDLSMVFFESRVLDGGREPVQLRLARVDAEFFDVFGTAPVLGRAFRDDERNDSVIVLEHDIWQRLYGGREDLVGDTITLDGEPVMVLGILPVGFAFPEWSDGLVPAGNVVEAVAGRRSFSLYGRVDPALSPRRAQAEVAVFGDALAAEHEDWARLVATDLLDETVADHRQGLLVLIVAVGGLLAIVCLELAMLQAVRAIGRRRELAVRTALGAGGGRMFADLASESLILAVAGGGLGLVVAQWGLDLVQHFGGDVPRLDTAAIDWRVMCFALAISVVVGLVAGLLPMRGVRRFDVQKALAGGRSQAGDGLGRLRHGLVIAQVAATVVLLVGAGLLVRTVVALDQVEPGIDVDRIASVGLVLPPNRYPDLAARTAWVEQLQAELEAEPGVAAATVTNYLPLQFDAEGLPEHAVEGSPLERLPAQVLVAGSSYFRTFGTPALVGREFDERDRAGVGSRVVVNAAFARRAWPGEPLSAVLGRRIVAWSDEGASFEQGAEVIGVVGDIRQSGLQLPAPPLVYQAYAQAGWSYVNVVARAETPGAADAILPAIRRAVWRLDPQRPLFDDASLAWRRSMSMRQPTLRAGLVGGFSICALLLSAIGLYGVFSFAVTQRRREIGVHLALGARGAQIRRKVVGEGVRLAAVGVAIGLGGAMISSRWLAGVLYGVEPTDPTTMLVVATVLLGTAWLAVGLPAGRASRLRPVEVLREQ
ncbi:MAG: ABC transporter permease, partial [Acidobacteriota bacterium]